MPLILLERHRPFANRRKEAGLSIHVAAVRLGVSEGYLRSLEAGRSPLTMRVASRMAHVFGCSVNNLFQRPTAQ